MNRVVVVGRSAPIPGVEFECPNCKQTVPHLIEHVVYLVINGTDVELHWLCDGGNWPFGPK